MSSIIQSICFPRDKFSIRQALKWITQHNFKITKVDVSKSLYRIRQYDPDELKQKGYDKYYVKVLNNGIEFVIAFN